MDGYDVVREAHRVRQLIALTGQYASVDEALTGTENLLLIGRLLGLPRLLYLDEPTTGLGVVIAELALRRSSLNEVFLALTGERPAEGSSA